MSDYVGSLSLAVGLEFLDKLSSAGESDLIDVFVDFRLCHADAVVAHRDCLFLLVDLHFDGQISKLTVEFASAGKGFQLLCRIDGIADYLT